MAVQVNGRVRAQIEVAPDMPQEDLRKLCLADSNVMKYVQGPVLRSLLWCPINL